MATGQDRVGTILNHPYPPVILAHINWRRQSLSFDPGISLWRVFSQLMQHFRDVVIMARHQSLWQV